MPRHPDFEKIYQAFMWRYCKGETECEEGKQIYYAWLKKLGLDDTKAYQYPQETREKFSWIQPHIQLIKEDDQAKYFKVEALFPLTSMNWNIYTREELIRACRTLIGKHTDLNHTTEIFPEIETVDADYEDDTVECLDRVLKGSKALSMLEKGEILQVSIEADCLRGSELTPEGWTCQGLVFTGKAYLTKDVLPGVPLTRIMPVEKLVESFTVTSVTNLNEPNSQNQAPEQNPAPPLIQPLVTPPLQQTPPPIGDPAGLEAEWTAAYINELPNSSFAVIEPAYLDGKTEDKRCRHLPFKDKDGTVDLPHLRNALARMNQIEPVTDSINAADLRAKAQKVLVAAAKDADVGDYEVLEKIDILQGKYEALKSEVEQLKKPKEEPKQEPKKEPCKCLLTKEGFWARFHQLRSEGLDKSDAFRIVSQEVIEVAQKKSQ